MRDLALFFKETPRTVWVRLLLLSALSAASNVGILLVVNGRVSQHDMSSRPWWQDALLFLSAVAIFAFAHRALIGGTTEMVEDRIRAFRIRIFAKIARLNLADVEKLKANDLYVCINAETQTVADASFAFATLGEQALVVICTLIYIGTISPVGLGAALVFVTIVAASLIWRDDRIAERYREVFALQGQYTEFVSDLLYGFKEVRLNDARAKALVYSASDTATTIYREKSRLSRALAGKHVFSEVSYFIFLALTVFGVPLLMNATMLEVATAAVSALFLIGPTFAVISAIPLLQKIAASVKSIRSTEDRIRTETEAISTAETAFPGFERISLRGVSYRYSAGGFRFGPVDMDIRRGEVVFITGRNGAGKSTLLKLLTGLYCAEGGQLKVDNQPVGPSNIDAYRNLFSAIFSNNHLFKTLYGISASDPEEIAALFDLMELTGKATIIGDQFSNTDLSSGQRKRLALIAMLLERRPICIFDEWAADQDTEFRRKFYLQLLPWLKSLGQTIVAVTHDEAYFHLADARIDLDSVHKRG